MVASTNGELYTPFQHPLAPIEDSSEEGSGLHSPVFGAPFPPHGDIRYNPDQGDFNAVSQFDYAANNGHHQPHPINTYPLVDPQQHPNLQPQTSSNEIPLHSPHSPTNNRLPPPPSADFFHSSSERRLPPFAPLDVASTSSSSSSGMPMDSNSNHSARQPSSSHIPNTSRRTEESSSPTTDRGNNSSSTRESARKEISMVVIACRQCRARKIRCDSTRPVCNNCVRRSNPCEYDLVPKRRGPDKRPGTRQRSCKKRPADGSAPSPNTAPPPSKRKRTMSAQAEDVKKENDTPPRRPSGLMIDTQGSGRHQPPSGSPLDYPPSARSIEGVILKGPPSGAVRQSALTIPPLEKGHQSFHGIPPSSDYNRNTWWDNLIGTYSTGRDQA
ncbi:hypothetical protein PLICRDRAFT_491523 [Plicaturopsis crispa FD-325 SS-3]|nr:hypothetical protein PLICRDRAFT_491523 [Plicaturopsis crispa FD-325 SS-3]